jgi:excisionase family DNA binding protein
MNFLETTLRDMDLSVRLVNALAIKGVLTINDLLYSDPVKLESTPGMGKKYYKETTDFVFRIQPRIIEAIRKESQVGKPTVQQDSNILSSSFITSVQKAAYNGAKSAVLELQSNQVASVHLEDERLDYAGAAEYLGVSKQTITKYKNNGVLKFYQTGRTVYFKKSEIDQALASTINNKNKLYKKVSDIEVIPEWAKKIEDNYNHIQTKLIAKIKEKDAIIEDLCKKLNQ